jgi:catechol 2,3-dioxygenase-like lactoylglutathione lyase family enzyme
MVRIGTIVLNVKNQRRASEFWSQALGYKRRDDVSDVLVPESGHGPGIAPDESDRTHLDLYTDSREEQLAEVERLISLGASRVEDWPYPDDADFIVLADTEGNLFDVINTAHE